MSFGVKRSMRKNTVIVGTGFEGRAHLIRKYCREGLKVDLIREPNNKYDSNAVAVYLKAPRLGGLLGSHLTQVGYIKANTAKSLAKTMDSGTNISAHVKSFWAPDNLEFPRITLEISDET